MTGFAIPESATAFLLRCEELKIAFGGDQDTAESCCFSTGRIDADSVVGEDVAA